MKENNIARKYMRQKKLYTRDIVFGVLTGIGGFLTVLFLLFNMFIGFWGIPLLVVGAVFGLLVFNFDATGSFMMMQFIVMFAVVSMFVVAVICHKTVSLSDICTLFFWFITGCAIVFCQCYKGYAFYSG